MLPSGMKSMKRNEIGIPCVTKVGGCAGWRTRRREEERGPAFERLLEEPETVHQLEIVSRVLMQQLEAGDGEKRIGHPAAEMEGERVAEDEREQEKPREEQRPAAKTHR